MNIRKPHFALSELRGATLRFKLRGLPTVALAKVGGILLPKTFNPPQERGKKPFPKILKVLIVFLIIILGLGYLFFYSSIFKVKNIIVDSSLGENSQSVLEKFKGKNIFFLNLKQIQKELAKQPDIEKVKIQRGLPDTIKISAESFQAKIVWRSRMHSYLVNANGLVFKEVEGMTDLPIVSDNNELEVKLQSAVVSANFITFIQDLSSKFPQKIGFNLTHFEINETIFQVDGVTDQGWFIKFDTTRSVDDQLDTLSKLLAEKKSEINEYVDVRVEGRVYYK